MRIVVIDDEMFVRKGIIYSVDWKQHGIEVVGDAADGKSGLELIRAKQPHVVLTDIKMPIMDGLEMIRIVRKELPHIKIVILSVLEDFHFVQEALRLGVTDYIQKMYIDPKELLTSIKKIKDSLALQKDPVDEKQNQPSLANTGFVEWLQGHNVSGFELQIQGSYLVGKAVARQHASFYYHPVEEDHITSLKRLLNECEEIVSQSLCIGEDSSGHIWFLIKPKATFNIESLQHALADKNKAAYSIGLSQILTDLSKRTEGCKQASIALERRFYTGDGNVHVYNSGASLLQPAQHFFSPNSLKNYEIALETLNLQDADLILKELFPEHIDESYTEIVVRNSVCQWISLVTLVLHEWGSSIPESIVDKSPYEQVASIEAYPELRKWVFRFHTVASEILQTQKSSQYRPEIERAIAYIRTHYSQQIRLEDVAREVNLSENYFSYLFAKETGKSFMQFLHETKIEQARVLLRNSNLHWVAVGEEVGFENPKYFSMIFKRFTKFTPKQYQNGSM